MEKGWEVTMNNNKKHWVGIILAVIAAIILADAFLFIGGTWLVFTIQLLILGGVSYLLSTKAGKWGRAAALVIAIIAIPTMFYLATANSLSLIYQALHLQKEQKVAQVAFAAAPNSVGDSAKAANKIWGQEMLNRAASDSSAKIRATFTGSNWKVFSELNAATRYFDSIAVANHLVPPPKQPETQLVYHGSDSGKTVVVTPTPTPPQTTVAISRGETKTITIGKAFTEIQKVGNIGINYMPSDTIYVVNGNGSWSGVTVPISNATRPSSPTFFMRSYRGNPVEVTLSGY